MTSNVMSLGGLALKRSGVLIDAVIVMVENGYRHLRGADRCTEQGGEDPHPGGCRATGGSGAFLFTHHHCSFVLAGVLTGGAGGADVPAAGMDKDARAGLRFTSLDHARSCADAFLPARKDAAGVAKSGRTDNAGNLPWPILHWCLLHWKLVVALNLIFLGATIPLYFRLGSQFMPALYEGSALYMPSALPGISITQAVSLMQEQDRIIRSFPEVSTVFGTVGRSDSATDNAPLDMYDTTIMLKPREQWRAGMTYQKLIQQMDEKLQFPGLTNTWTMPVENRLDMELTGIKTAVGIKIQGPDLAHIEDIGARMQSILAGIPDTNSVFAERVSQGFYLNVEVNRPVAARYGLSVADVQSVISSEIGGANIAQNVEGRERFPISVRYQRDFRDHPEDIAKALIPTATGEQIPLGQVARVYFTRGPAMIRDEDGALTGYVYLNLKTHDYGGYVQNATQLLQQKLTLAPGYTWRWAGEYEFEMRAKQRMKMILPIVFFIIFLLLYLVFKSAAEAAVLIFPTLYAMSGGLLLQWMLGYNFSVAVWVGYIALFGIAVETGVVMVVYLDEAFQAGIAQNPELAGEELIQVVIVGAVQRLRPKLMTVTCGDSESCADFVGDGHWL